MSTVAQMIVNAINGITETKVITISEPTRDIYNEIYYFVRLAYAISNIFPSVSPISYDRNKLTMINLVDNSLIIISFIIDVVYDMIEIVCEFKN